MNKSKRYVKRQPAAKDSPDYFMLTPRELYNAMSFPPDYKIDRDYAGNEYKKIAQVARCGNAVCPPMAEAVVRANYVAAPVKYQTMEQLMGDIAV